MASPPQADRPAEQWQPPKEPRPRRHHQVVEIELPTPDDGLGEGRRELLEASRRERHLRVEASGKAEELGQHQRHGSASWSALPTRRRLWSRVIGVAERKDGSQCPNEQATLWARMP